VGLDIPSQAPVGVTDEEVGRMIVEAGSNRSGFTMNRMKGTPGEFYRDNRAEDIRSICLQLLKERVPDLPI
jgi:hypothetical protein